MRQRNWGKSTYFRLCPCLIPMGSYRATTEQTWQVTTWIDAGLSPLLGCIRSSTQSKTSQQFWPKREWSTCFAISMVIFSHVVGSCTAAATTRVKPKVSQNEMPRTMPCYGWSHTCFPARTNTFQWKTALSIWNNTKLAQQGRPCSMTSRSSTALHWRTPSSPGITRRIEIKSISESRKRSRPQARQDQYGN